MRPFLVPRLVTRSALVAALALVCAGGAGCREDGTGIEVKELSFTGVEAVSADDLRSVLSTTVSSRLPWGEKFFFDRAQFEADLKRVVAFYRDRGYPEARVIGEVVATLPGQQPDITMVDT